MANYLATEHEYSLDGGATWTPCTSTTVNVGNVAKAINQVQVRVKADPGTGRPAGIVLGNASVFTVTSNPGQPAAPTVTFNTSTRILEASHANYPTSELEYSANGGTSYLAYAALSIDDFAHAANTWLYRVKADSATSRPTGLTAGNDLIVAKSTAPSAPFIGAHFGQLTVFDQRGFVDPDPGFSQREDWNGANVFANAGNNASTTPGTYAAPAITTPGSNNGPMMTAPFDWKAPNFGMGLEVLHSYGTGAGGDDNQVLWGLGWGDPTNESTRQFICAKWSGKFGFLYFTTYLNGVETDYMYNGSGVPFAPPYARLGWAISDEFITLIAQDPAMSLEQGVFRQALTYELRNSQNQPLPFDFRDEAFLSQIEYAFVMFRNGGNTTGSTFEIGPVEFGYLQGVGGANHAPIKYSDGGFAEAGGVLLYGGSEAHLSAGGGAYSIRTANGCILEIDAFNQVVRTRAKLFAKYTMADGTVRILGQNAYAFVQDVDTGLWYCNATTWGTNGLPAYRMHTRSYVTPELPRGVYVYDEGTEMDLPTYKLNTTVPATDNGEGFNEDLCREKINGAWYAAYSVNNNTNAYFTMMVVTGPTPEGPWTVVGRRVSQQNQVLEGLKFVRENGNIYLIAADSVLGAQGRVPVFHLDANLTDAGELTYEIIGQGGSPGHPGYATMQLADGSSQDYILFFDGTKFNNHTYTWGRLVFFRMVGTRAGHAYPSRPLPA